MNRGRGLERAFRGGNAEGGERDGENNRKEERNARAGRKGGRITARAGKKRPCLHTQLYQLDNWPGFLGRRLYFGLNVLFQFSFILLLIDLS